MGIHKPQCVEERLATLGLWQHREKHKFNLKEFARAGFFFEHSFDSHDDPGRLRCAYCPAVIGNWQAEDDPWTEHALSVAHCPHITDYKGQDFIENVKKEEEEEEEMLEITDDLGDFICPDETNSELFFEEINDDVDIDLFGIPTYLMRNEQKVDSSMNCGQKLGGPGGNPCRQHRYNGTRTTSGQKSSLDKRDMGSKEARLASFEHVRHLIKNDGLLNRIAESGFYFEGINEYGIKVRCYSCGCGLYDINDEDDLWYVHAQMTNCEHVMHRKGRDFILQAQAMDTSLDQEAIPLSECQPKKRKMCESTGNNLETGISKKPCTQRPDPSDEHYEQQSCIQRSRHRKDPDTKKRHAQRSVLPGENNAKAHVQFIQRPEPSEERDAKKLCTDQAMSSNYHDVKNPSLLIKKHGIKKLCTKQSKPSEKHTCEIAPGCKRRPRFYNYNRRWYLIRWCALVTTRAHCGQHGNHRGPIYTGKDMDQGPNTDDIVFLCCDIKLCKNNSGRGPCPNCLQDKHV